MAREYQKLARDASIYALGLVRIPAPRFTVFYNGRKERPDKEVFKLSDAYFTREKEPELELKVTALNISAQNNKELLEQCRTLKEYVEYVECVRRYADMPNVTLEDAVSRAVDECIKKGILADFLRRNKAEAISVSIFEYNEAEEKEKLRRAEYAIGYEAGVEKGIEKGIEQGIKVLIEDCLEQGIGKKQIIEKLEKRFGLESHRALQYFEKYGAAETLTAEF